MNSEPQFAADVLLVEDDADDARYVERLVHNHRSDRIRRLVDAPIVIGEFAHADRLSDAREWIRTRAPHVVLLDLMLPDSQGLETVDSMVENAPGVPIVVLTGRADVEIGIEAIQRGADEYLIKDAITAEGLLRTIRYAIERNRHRRKLRERMQRLALLNRVLRQDIRNDVSMVVGLTDQLHGRVDSRDESTVETILETSRHVVELSDMAADLTGVLSSDEVVRESRNLSAVIDEEVRRLRRERDVTVTFDCDSIENEPVYVCGSPMLGSVFRQLLSNAVDHSDRSTPAVTVAVETAGDRASVTITDDGIGIPDAQKELLIDPDARFDEQSGMGVGLYLVTTVLEEIGGEFEIDDNRPRGTTVTVTLNRSSQQ